MPISAALPNGQRGAFSPFMFGLIMGMSVFSVLSMQWANQELARYRQKQLEQAKQNAQDIAKGMDFAIRTETGGTYSDKYTLDRARAYSDSTGKTAGDQDYMVKVNTNGAGKTYDQANASIAIAGTDDTLLRSEIYRADSAQDVLQQNHANQPVVVYDTALARDSQVRTSNERMKKFAEQVYAYYSANFSFPSADQFTALAKQFGLADAWGQPFHYSVDDDGQTAYLSFTTPWNYTQTLKLSLNDDGQ